MVRILQCGNAPAAPATRPRFLTRTKEEVRISFLPLNLRLQHPTLPVSTALQDLESRCMTRVGCLAVPLIAFTLFGQSVSEVEITAEPHHRLALENQYVRVFKVDVPPHESTLMHRHRHDYVFVTLGASEVSNEVAGKPPVTLKLKDGETRFTPGNFAHIAKNLTDAPFRNVTIEFLQDEKARQSPPPKWAEERGLHVLEGGTQEILLVKNGARVSE